MAKANDTRRNPADQTPTAVSLMFYPEDAVFGFASGVSVQLDVETEIFWVVTDTGGNARVFERRNLLTALRSAGELDRQVRVREQHK